MPVWKFILQFLNKDWEGRFFFLVGHMKNGWINIFLLLYHLILAYHLRARDDGHKLDLSSQTIIFKKSIQLLFPSKFDKDLNIFTKQKSNPITRSLCKAEDKIWPSYLAKSEC